MRTLLLLVALTFAVPSSAQPILPKGERVNLLGHWVTPNHWVMGRVMLQQGKQTMVSLGWRHGLTEGNFLVAIRPFEGRYLNLGWMSVSKVKRDQTLCRMLGKGTLKKGDWVVIPAAELDLWHGNKAMNEDIIRRLVQMKRRNGYSTLNLSTTGESVKRIMRAEANAKLAFWNREFLKTRPDYLPEEDAAEKKLRELRALKNPPIGQDGKPVPLKQLVYPTEREWLKPEFALLERRGWAAIPNENKKLADDEVGRESLLPKLSALRKKVPYWKR